MANVMVTSEFVDAVLTNYRGSMTDRSAAASKSPLINFDQ
jgi:hypothetical protein